MGRASNESLCILAYVERRLWIYAIKCGIAVFAVAGNLIVMAAILQNWKCLCRQHNFYRYLLSLIAADIISGFTLLIHALFWLINMSVLGNVNFTGETVEEVLKNLLTGISNANIFASLAAATLLNLVVRANSTQAISRAAAVTDNSSVSFGLASCFRSPKITLSLVCSIWIAATAFVLLPVFYHCHSGLEYCVERNTSGFTDWKFLVMDNNMVLDALEHAEAYDCSALKSPSRRTYLLLLNSCSTLFCFLMILCNLVTTCTKTHVQRVRISSSSGEIEMKLKLRHSVGVTRDSSSIFAFAITLSMTISSLPHIIFTFMTEGGSDYDRLHYSHLFNGPGKEAINLFTYASCIVNPLIYTFTLSRVRTGILLLLEQTKRRNTRESCGDAAGLRYTGFKASERKIIKSAMPPLR